MAQLKTQFRCMQEKLGLPLTFLAAMGGSLDKYRKPAPTMYRYFAGNLNGNHTIDLKESTYCGDAAGRAATKTTKKDHSADDKVFAAAIGLSF